MTINLQTYPKYKESGLEWLSQIPSGWTTTKLFELYVQKKEYSDNDEELLSVYRDHGVILKSSRNDNHNKPSEDLSNYLLVKPNDLVINKMKAWQGSVAISRYRGIVSPAYFTYKLQKIANGKIFLPYLHHLLRSSAYIETYKRISTGIRPAQWDLDPYQFKILLVLLPPFETQRCIADFLDEKTKIIDELVAKKEKLIDFLREKRAALIIHAVTKGLDPNAKMKPSGIDWLGDVPEEWWKIPLKFLFSYQSGGIWGDEARNDENDLICVRVADFDFVEFVAHSNDFTFRNVPNLKKELILNEYSILLEKSGGGDQQPVGRTIRYLEKEKATCSNFIQKLQVNTKYNPEFIILLLSMLYFSGVTMKVIKKTTGIQNLDLAAFLRTNIYLPSKDEQKSIVDFINMKSTNIINTIKRMNLQIEQLKEYRSSLIYSAVTGKIKV